MIKLTRLRTTSTITSGLRGKNRAAKNLRVLELKKKLGDIPSSEFKSSLWKPAKKQLKKESNNKCAYCEADTRVVAHGDVEHFRPKNVYWWLAYCYDNYLYSCQICNQTFKSNKFPISGKKLPSPRVAKNSTATRLKSMAETLTPDPLDTDADPKLDDFIASIIKEEPDLIDPYMFDPEEVLVWEVDAMLKEVKVRVAPRVPKRAAKQKAIDEVYGLNREELRTIRYQDYRAVKVIAEAYTALAPARPEMDLVKDMRLQLNDMMADEHRFAGMIRYFVRKVWKIENLD